MTRDFSLVKREDKGSGNAISVLLAVMVMISVPFMATANEDLDLIERSTGPSSNGKLGWNLTAVMDLNGDGRTDYAVTSPGSDMVYVFHGPIPASYSMNSADWRISGPSSSSFGWSVSGVEDYNSDGYDDLLIGAPDISRAYVFKGRSSAPGSISHASAAITLEGVSGDLFGHSVASINYDNTSSPDYNAFIYAAVGAPRDIHYIAEIDDDYQSGAVFLFNLTSIHDRGLSSHNTSQANITFQGGQQNSWFGFAVENLGNIDGDPDDLHEFGISDPYFNKTGEQDNGAFYIQNGKNVLLEPRFITPGGMDGYILGNQGSRFGWSVKALGDISPSPEADFAVGAPWEDQTSPSVQNVGCAHVFYGTTGSFQIELSPVNNADIEFWGLKPGDRMGWSIARADLAGPNTYTIAVGAPGYDNGTSPDAGAVFTFWDWNIRQNYTTARSKFYGENAGDNLGYSMEGVYYRSEEPDYVKLMVSAVHYGANDVGSVNLFERNLLPSLSNLYVSPNKGNELTDFEIKVLYKDLDGNPPEYVKVYVYKDSQGTQVVDTITLGNPEGVSHEAGVNYSKITRLPSSITPSNTDRPLYFRAEARAVRGSRERVTFPSLVNPAQNPRAGPVVDGVAPSAATEIYEGTQDPDADEEGIFKIGWEWPEENAGFDDISNDGKVAMLSMALREGDDNVITEGNWNDTGRLDEGKTIFYINFTDDVEKPKTRTTGFYVGRDSDLEMNPNSVQLTPRMNYNVAFRAVDEEGNWGPVSENLMVETWWRRPYIPAIDSISVVDHTGEDDNGHMLNISWNPVDMQDHPEDLHYYWIFLSEEPFEGLEELGRDEPDYNISKENDYESFLDRYKVVEYYNKGGEQVQLQTGSSYYVTVVPFNWLDQRLEDIVVEGPEKVIDNDAPPIPRLQEVEAKNHLDDGHHILLTWEQVSDQKFVEYQIWGQKYYFNDIEEAFLVANIPDRTTTQLVINEVGDEEVYQGTEYFFAVLVLDYNDHMDTTIDQNNSAKVKTFDPNGEPIDQIKGVSLKDRGADDGGVLQVTWFNLIAKGHFWQYNIYFSDEEFSDVTVMEPTEVINNYRIGEYEISELDGEPLVDGKMYYCAVTIVSWDLVENTELTTNNYDSAEPINQSDTIPPQITVPGADFDEETVTETSFTIYWDQVTEDMVQDFDHYLVQWRGTRSGSIEISTRNRTSFTVSGLSRGEEYWFNITIVDDNGNVGPATDSIRVITAGVNTPPVIEMIKISISNDVYNRTFENADEVIELKEDQVRGQDIYFTGTATDDYTSLNNLEFTWNITTPDNTYIERYGYVFPLEVQNPGLYVITLQVEDNEGGVSEPLTIDIDVEKAEESAGIPGWVWILVLVGVFLIAAAVVVFVMVSGKSSQKKQMLEQYKDRRKDIEAMDPIYTNLPTWTCDCDTTQVKITENAYCNSCYQSHEAVPVDGIDDYLKDHELVLSEMKISVPPGWQGQEKAIEDAKKDLEDRKERALKALNQEYALWLKGTEYESEIPEEEEEDMEERGGGAIAPSGAIIPGQMPPSSPTQSTPITPQPMPPQGQVPPTQASPMQPRPTGSPGQPQPMQQRPTGPPAQPQPSKQGQQPQQ